MTIAYVGGNANFSATSPFTLALPALAAGDIVLVYASIFSNNTQVGLTGSVNTPTQLLFGFNGVNDSYMAWAFTAAAPDSGATLTFTEVGVSTYIGGIIQVYSGAAMPTPGSSYALGGFDGANTQAWPAPSLPSPVAGCWGVYFITAGINGGDGPAVYPGGTLRQQNGPSGVNGFDSAASVGGAGTTVGGGTWTTTSNGPTVGITIALPPATAIVTGVTATIAPAAPAGSVQAGATIAGAVGASALAAPAGSVSAGAKVSGPVAAESLAAPAGAVRIAPQQGAVTISNALAGSVTIVNTI